MEQMWRILRLSEHDTICVFYCISRFYGSSSFERKKEKSCIVEHIRNIKYLSNCCTPWVPFSPSPFCLGGRDFIKCLLTFHRDLRPLLEVSLTQYVILFSIPLLHVNSGRRFWWTALSGSLGRLILKSHKWGVYYIHTVSFACQQTITLDSLYTGCPCKLYTILLLEHGCR